MTQAEEAKQIVDEIEKFTNSWEDVPVGADTQRLAIRVVGLQRARAAECAYLMVDKFYKTFGSWVPRRVVAHGADLLKELKKIQNESER